MGIFKGCNCLGIKSASEVTVKRYNVLVPDIFPAQAPDFHKDLPNGIQKKIKKLGEYLEKYPERSEKVSRRLERRLRKDLSHESYGMVKIACYAYVHLLKVGGQSGAAWLCKELLGDDEAYDSYSIPVVPTLLKHQKPELRAWALDILAQFACVQTDSRYLSKIEEYMDGMCSMARATAESLNNPSPEVLKQIRSASLMALSELLKLNGRTQTVPAYLERIVECGLENYNLEGPVLALDDPFEDAVAGQGEDVGELRLLDSNHAQPAPAQQTGEAEEEEENVNGGLPGGKGRMLGEGPRRRSLQGLESTMQKTLVKVKTLITRNNQPSDKPPVHSSDPALQLMENVAEFSKDSIIRRRVLECMFKFYDSRQYWATPDKVEGGISIMRKGCTEDHQFFVLFSSLIRHLSSQRLSAVDRATLIKFAAAEGELQQSAFSSPALVFALSELPQYLPLPADSPNKKHLEHSILACLQRLAAALPDSASILEAVNGLLDRLSLTTSIATASLQCIDAAVSVVPTKEQSTRESLLRIPQALLEEVVTVIWSWKELEARTTAHSILQTLLVPSCASLTSSQVSNVLSACWDQMRQPSAEPEVFALVSGTLLAVLDSSMTQEALLSVLPFALTLQQELLHPTPGNMDQMGSGQRIAGLVVADLLLEKLAQLLPCQGLAELCTNAEPKATAVEVVESFVLTATTDVFPEADEAEAAKSLRALQAAAPSDVTRSAAAALDAARLPKEVGGERWQPIQQTLVDRSSLITPGRLMDISQHAAPSERVLQELQANFATLAITHEDVLMTGAVGVGTLLEAARGQAMEAELAAAKVPMPMSERQYSDLIAEAAVYVQIAEF